MQVKEGKRVMRKNRRPRNEWKGEEKEEVCSGGRRGESEAGDTGRKDVGFHLPTSLGHVSIWEKRLRAGSNPRFSSS